MKIHVQVFIWTFFFKFFWAYACSGIAASYGNPVANLFRNGQNIFQNVCTISWFYQEYMRFSIFPNPRQFIVCPPPTPFLRQVSVCSQASLETHRNSPVSASCVLGLQTFLTNFSHPSECKSVCTVVFIRIPGDKRCCVSFCTLTGYFYIIFGEKCLFKSFAYFWVFFLLSCKSYLYILGMSIFSNIWFANIFICLSFQFLVWWGSIYLFLSPVLWCNN